MNKFLLILFLPTMACAGTHMQRGDAAGGDLSGTYPNPSLSASATGYIRNASSLQSGSTFYTSSGTVNGQLTAGTLVVGYGGATVYGYESLVSGSFYGPGASLNFYNIDGFNLASLLEVGPSGTGQLLFTGGLSFGGGANQFVTTDNSSPYPMLTTYDLMASSPNPTGQWNFSSQQPSTFTVLSVIDTSASTKYAFRASTTAAGPYTLAVSTVGHINYQDFGSSPTLSGCGTSSALIGNDTIFQITGGTGANGCTATFAKPYTKVPICQVSQESMSLVNALSYSTTATAVTITQTAMGTSKLDVHCFGRD